MANTTLNPIAIFSGIYRHRYLLGQLILRDVLLRYRGALFGVLWIFLSPLMMLAAFSFVFGQVFLARWPLSESSPPYWLLIYSGLIAFNMFADSFSRAPSSVRNHPNFVKKIIFPVNILPLVPLGSAVVHGIFNFLILIAALAWTHCLHSGVFLFPLLVVPSLLLALGLSWFIAAWGVFVKDMNQIVPMLVQLALFLSPVFYPVSAIPERFRAFYLFNPLGTVIETSRAAVLGSQIDWKLWIVAFGISLLIFVSGYSFFMHSSDEFADAL